MRAFVLCALLAASAVPGSLSSAASQPNQLPSGFVEMRPADLKWVPNPAVPGGQTAIVFGDTARPVPYAIRVRIPPGARVLPHRHPESRTYTVLAGEWKLGFGRVFDAAALRSYPAGSVYYLPAGIPHFQAADAPDTVVQIEGTGPSATIFIDPRDDPRKK